jgi:methylglyoxal synthase
MTMKDNFRIALVAHDNKKADMVSFVMKRMDFFNNDSVEIWATGTTGKHIYDAGLKKVNRLLSGPLGGDAQIASLIVEKKIDALIFFVDPLDVHPHQVDVSMLLRICNVHNIPVAPNYATAKGLVSYWKNKLFEEQTDFQSFQGFQGPQGFQGNEWRRKQEK